MVFDQEMKLGAFLYVKVGGSKSNSGADRKRAGNYGLTPRTSSRKGLLNGDISVFEVG